MARSNTANAFETSTTSIVAGTSTSVDVDTTEGTPDTPFYVAFRPTDNDNREYWKVSSKTATSITVDSLDDRHLEGSAAASGQEHPEGTLVKIVPAAQMFGDLWDEAERLDTAKSENQHGDADHSEPYSKNPHDNADHSTNFMAQDGGEYSSVSGDIVNHGSTSGTLTLDLSVALDHIANLNGDTTLAFSNWPTARATYVMLEVSLDGHDLTFPSEVKTPLGEPLSIQGRTLLVFRSRNSGTIVEAMIAGVDFS